MINMESIHKLIRRIVSFATDDTLARLSCHEKSVKDDITKNYGEFGFNEHQQLSDEDSTKMDHVRISLLSYIDSLNPEKPENSSQFTQKEIIEQIKDLKRELRSKFDDKKLIHLYYLIDLLK